MNDCGVYALLSAYKISLGLRPIYTKDATRKFRRQIALALDASIIEDGLPEGVMPRTRAGTVDAPITFPDSDSDSDSP